MPYNFATSFAAESFHTKKLCSTLFPKKIGGAENAGREIAGRENDGPSSKA